MAEEIKPPAPAAPVTPVVPKAVIKPKPRRAKIKQAARTPPAPPKPVTPPLSPAQLAAAAAPAQPPAQPPPQAIDPDGDVLEQLFTMSLRRTDVTKPSNDPGMQLVQAIAQQFSQAKPISTLDTSMMPHLGEMSSKIHLMLNALNYHNLFERGALYSLARWTLEKGLWNDLMSGQLSPSEKLALLGMAIKEMDKVETKLGSYKEDLDKGGRGTMADIQSTSEKIDRSVVKEDDTAAKELAGTSAVGREVTRRLLDKASKALDKKVQEQIALSAKEPAK